MEILTNRFYIFLLLLTITLSSCRKNELEEDLVSVLEESSGEEIIIVDSLKTNLPGMNTFVQGYFHIRYQLIKDTSFIGNVVIYESSQFGVRTYVLHPQQRNYFIDINVSSNNEFTFNFALVDLNGKVSKKSKSYTVFVP